MTKWEYKSVFLAWPRDLEDTDELDSDLCSLGAQGWELVAVHGYQISPDELFVFKRPMIEDAKPT